MPKHNTPDEFFTWLDAYMKDLELTDNKLAKRARLSPSVISKARSGYQGIGWEASAAIARTLNLPPEIVFRKAGLLPPQDDERSLDVEELLILFSGLDMDDKEELLQLARLKLERSKKRVAHGKIKTF